MTNWDDEGMLQSQFPNISLVDEAVTDRGRNDRTYGQCTRTGVE